MKSTPSRDRMFVLRVLFASLGCFFALSTGLADSDSARFHVGATVLPTAALTAIASREGFFIDQSDIARGIVELPDATLVEVRSNSVDGYILNVHSMAPIFTSVEILGFDSAVRLDADGGAIARRSNRGTTRLSIGYRLYLRPDLSPGFYRLPLHLSVSPL